MLCFRSCQSTCHTLDLESQLDEPHLPWFWPPISLDEKNAQEEHETDEDEDDNTTVDNRADLSNSEKIDCITDYLRTTYLFCYWCSIRYKDEEDLNGNCPGLTKDDHLS